MKKLFILIFILSVLVTHSTGKQLQPKFDLIDAREGLSSSHIISILQDKKGFMWLGTINGLVKYDGYRWTIYRKELLHPKIPHTQMIMSLYEDNEDILWLGARNSLTRFDRTREIFEHYQITVPDSALSHFSQISRILGDPIDKNILWIHVLGNIARFDKSTGQFKFFGVKGDKSKLRDIGFIIQVQIDPKGYLWIASPGNLSKYDPHHDSFMPFRKKGFTPPQPGHPASIGKSTVDPGIFWLGYVNAFERLDIETGASIIYTLPLKDSFAIITAIVESRSDKDTLLLATWQHGLIKFNLNSKAFSHYRHKAGNRHSLASDTIYSLFQDQNGTLWMGTGSGLNRLERRKNLIEIIGKKHNHQTGLNNELVYSLYKSTYRPGRFWICTSDGLHLYDRAKHKFQLFSFGDSSPIGPNNILSCLESGHYPGVLWIATMGGGLFKFNIDKETHGNYLPDKKNKSSINTRFPLTLYESRNKLPGLWIGGMNKGLSFLDYKTEEFRHYPHDEKNNKTISFGPVSDIYESKYTPGILWIGTIGGGFSKLNMENGVFTRFEHDLKNPSSLSSDIVSGFFESPEDPGILWIGTTHGLNRFQMKSETFTDFPAKTRLADFFINGIIEDQEGHFWITTFRGLVRYTPGDGTILHLDARDGFSSNEMTDICLSNDGEVLLGSMNGMNIFRPKEIRRNNVVPPVVITGLQTGSQPVKTGGIFEKPSVTLSYRDRVFSFHYAALNYSVSVKNQYAYKMEGFDQDWNHLGNRRMTMFTGLPPGEYTFRVKGSNNDGVWNETGASLKVIIKPPWWRTTWAYMVYGLAILLLVFTLNRVQRRRLIRKERDHAKIVEADLRARAAEAQAWAMEAESQRKTEELENARKLQLSMLPHQVPDLPGMEIGVYMHTATEVGGDYYDFLTSSEGELTVAFGDATGHGLNAGTMVSIIKGVLMSTHPVEDLKAFFTTCTATMKRMKLGNLFMGLTLLQQHGDNWRAISAGMPPIHVYSETQGKVVTYLQKTPPLGAFSKYTYAPQPIILKKGDTVLLFSDGLPELFNEKGDMFGFGTVRDCFEKAASSGLSPDEIIEYLRETGENWRQQGSQDDDITFVVLKISNHN